MPVQVAGMVFQGIRQAAASVASRARFITLDEARLRDLAHELANELTHRPLEPATPDPAHHYVGDAATTLAFVVTLDAVNFGSGWFPFLDKLPGLSGYFTVATRLKEHFERHGAFSARQLAALDGEACRRIFGQMRAEPGAEVAELMDHFAAALRDLGEFLEARHAGRFEGLIEQAAGSAEELVRLLSEMPYYRDVSRYEELEVPFYKRAQLTAADLNASFAGAGFGSFRDLASLTIFADNLVPHVLRCEGVLHYDAALARRIEAGELLVQGTAEEVEIRALAVHAVERMLGLLRAEAPSAGLPGTPTAQRLDSLLWNRGQRPEIKAHPRHRARCVYY
jgi:hypothetical protein